MIRRLGVLAVAAFLVSLVVAPVQRAGAVETAKHVWVPPVEVTQALKIRMEQKATAKLLRKADHLCMDETCKAQVDECRKVLKTCVIVPSQESVQEMEVENN